MTIPPNEPGIGNGLAGKLLCLLKMDPGKPTQIPKASCSGKSLVQEKVTITIKADRRAWRQRCSARPYIKD